MSAFLVFSCVLLGVILLALGLGCLQVSFQANAWPLILASRSEERRVGKECRSRCSCAP